MTDIPIYRPGPLKASGEAWVAGVGRGATPLSGKCGVMAAWAEQLGATAAGAQLTGLRAKLRPGLLWKSWHFSVSLCQPGQALRILQPL